MPGDFLGFSRLPWVEPSGRVLRLEHDSTSRMKGYEPMFELVVTMANPSGA